MINIDVQGSLFPNPLTMIVQLLSTLIIFLAVKKWLWKPVKNILAKRSDAMQSSLDNAFKQNEEASQNLAKAKAELDSARNSSKEIIDSARLEASNLKQEIINDANKQAQTKLEEADKRIESARKEMQNELHDEIVGVAMAAVEKLLEEKATSKDDQKAIEKFVEEVKK